MRLNGGALAMIGGGPSPLKVQNLFAVSTWSGNGGGQVITPGLPLNTPSEVWVKWRGGPTNTDGVLFNSSLGAGKGSFLNRAAYPGGTFNTNLLNAFNSNSFSLGSDATVNALSQFYVAWSFIEAKGFFRTAIWTGNNTPGRAIPIDLGQPPGLVLINRLTNNLGVGVQDGAIWHRSFSGLGRYACGIRSNTTDPATPGLIFGDGTLQVDPTATALTVSADAQVNYPTEVYLARIFAHQPGPGGIVACGAFRTDSSGNALVNTLGWQPQFVMLAQKDRGDLTILDAMEGLTTSVPLYTSGGLSTYQAVTQVSGGFSYAASVSPTTDFYYVAIRKGPL